MAATNESGLEPAPNDFPEVTTGQQKGPPAHDYPEVDAQPQQHHQYPASYAHQAYDAAPMYPKQNYPAPPSSYYGEQTIQAPYTPPPPSEKSPATVAIVPSVPAPTSRPPSNKRTIFGCSFTILVLSFIIALLSAAVIGLSAATAMEAKRANENASRLAALDSSSSTNGPSSSSESSPAVSSANGSSTNGSSEDESSDTKPSATTGGASVTVTVTKTAGETSSAPIDDGCAADPGKVTGSKYKAYPVIGERTFTRYCNKGSNGETIFVLITPNFASCMDACSAYTNFIPKIFGSTDKKATCGSVSFIPPWTSREAALKENTRGNCFLRAGPQSEADLTPEGKVTAHVGILDL